MKIWEWGYGPRLTFVKVSFCVFVLSAWGRERDQGDCDASSEPLALARSKEDRQRVGGGGRFRIMSPGDLEMN